MKNAEVNRRLGTRGFGKVAECCLDGRGRGSSNGKFGIVALYDLTIAEYVSNAVLWDANRRLVELVEAWFPEVQCSRKGNAK